MSAQTETQEAEVQSDGPLLDLTDAGVKKFIKQAKARGYVTMEDLNKVLPSEEVTPDAIEDTLASWRWAATPSSRSCPGTATIMRTRSSSPSGS